ncbi:MAG TPA: hypothetical protein VKT82_07040 [Ktedonobacterales bacterium]|nr:hypothetical protein [Ktedonobacterales bacterium]
MLEFAVFTLATCIAALMLIASVRALTWHKVSPPLSGLLLLLVLFVTWQVVARSSPFSPEQWLLFILCALVGLVVGLMRGQAAPMEFVPSEGDVLCRRNALLMFCWAAALVVSITLLTIPGLHAPTWKAAMPPALIFLTAAFTLSTCTIFARASTLRRDYLARSEQEPQVRAQESS